MISDSAPIIAVVVLFLAGAGTGILVALWKIWRAGKEAAKEIEREPQYVNDVRTLKAIDLSVEFVVGSGQTTWRYAMFFESNTYIGYQGMPGIVTGQAKLDQFLANWKASGFACFDEGRVIVPWYRFERAKVVARNIYDKQVQYQRRVRKDESDGAHALLAEAVLTGKGDKHAE